MNEEEVRRAVAGPDDWVVPADLDELNQYPLPLPELVRLLAAGGYTHVTGTLVDRLAADGALRPLPRRARRGVALGTSSRSRPTSPPPSPTARRRRSSSAGATCHSGSATIGWRGSRAGRSRCGAARTTSSGGPGWPRRSPGGSSTSAASTPRGSSSPSAWPSTCADMAPSTWRRAGRARGGARPMGRCRDGAARPVAGQRLCRPGVVLRRLHVRRGAGGVFRPLGLPQLRLLAADDPGRGRRIRSTRRPPALGRAPGRGAAPRRRLRQGSHDSPGATGATGRQRGRRRHRDRPRRDVPRPVPRRGSPHR